MNRVKILRDNFAARPLPNWRRALSSMKPVMLSTAICRDPLPNRRFMPPATERPDEHSGQRHPHRGIGERDIRTRSGQLPIGPQQRLDGELPSSDRPLPSSAAHGVSVLKCFSHGNTPQTGPKAGPNRGLTLFILAFSGRLCGTRIRRKDDASGRPTARSQEQSGQQGPRARSRSSASTVEADHQATDDFRREGWPVHGFAAAIIRVGSLHLRPVALFFPLACGPHRAFERIVSAHSSFDRFSCGFSRRSKGPCFLKRNEQGTRQPGARRGGRPP